MPLIQIPLEPPPPQQRPGYNPDQGDLFDTNSWESAYRELHDFPTLLIQTRDELARSRKREAFWISLIAHIILILIIVNSPKFEKYLPHRAVMLVHTGRDNDKLTFLETPRSAEAGAASKDGCHVRQEPGRDVACAEAEPRGAEENHRCLASGTARASCSADPATASSSSSCAATSCAG